MASRHTPTASSPASRETRSADLLAFERGDIDREVYVERCVEAALRGLAERLAPSDLERVRNVVREQVETDPVILATIARLTRRADGNSQ